MSNGFLLQTTAITNTISDDMSSSQPRHNSQRSRQHTPSKRTELGRDLESPDYVPYAIRSGRGRRSRGTIPTEPITRFYQIVTIVCEGPRQRIRGVSIRKRNSENPSHIKWVKMD